MLHSSGAPPHSITTRLARISLAAPGLLEQRYHPGAKLDVAGFEENRRARFELADDIPHVMLSVFPEHLDFELAAATTDHFGQRADRLAALGVVAGDTVMEMITKLHFSYYPPTFAMRIFSDEGEARAWLLERLAELDPEKSEAGQ